MIQKKNRENLILFFSIVEGLFNRAICMSGLATAPYNEPTKNPLALARRQAELVDIENIDNLTTHELIDRLRAVNASLLVDSSNELKFWSVDPLTTYRPVIEKEAPGAFITRHPAEIWESGDFQHVPWMTGVVANEGSVRTAGKSHSIRNLWTQFWVFSHFSYHYHNSNPIEQGSIGRFELPHGDASPETDGNHAERREQHANHNRAIE